MKDENEKDIIKLDFTKEQIFALQISVADQLTLFQGAINAPNIEPESRSKAHNLLELYRNLLDLIDIDDDKLLDQWDTQATMIEKRAEVIDLASVRKEREIDEHIEQE